MRNGRQKNSEVPKHLSNYFESKYKTSKKPPRFCRPFDAMVIHLHYLF